MTVRKVVSRSWMLFRQNLPKLLLLTLIQLLPRVIALAPLLFLMTKNLKLLAALCPVLFILVVLPFRMNEGQVYRNICSGQRLSMTGILYMGDYGKRLGRALKTGLLLLLWGLPFLAATVYGILAYNGVTMDVFTMLRSVMAIGNDTTVTALLPGWSSATLRGIIVILVIYMLTLVPLALGCAVHSWRRFRKVTELMRFRGRGKLVLCRMIGALTLLPFVAVTGATCSGFFRELINSLSNLMSGGFKMPSLGSTGYIILAAFVLLYLPRLSFSILLPAECTEESKV